jgi:hypothetical protein
VSKLCATSESDIYGYKRNINSVSATKLGRRFLVLVLLEAREGSPDLVRLPQVGNGVGDGVVVLQSQQGGAVATATDLVADLKVTPYERHASRERSKTAVNNSDDISLYAEHNLSGHDLFDTIPPAAESGEQH